MMHNLSVPRASLPARNNDPLLPRCGIRLISTIHWHLWQTMLYEISPALKELQAPLVTWMLQAGAGECQRVSAKVYWCSRQAFFGITGNRHDNDCGMGQAHSPSSAHSPTRVHILPHPWEGPCMPSQVLHVDARLEPEMKSSHVFFGKFFSTADLLWK